ncbi:MAG: methyltransferase domain-containing protein [Solirubrobacterales bacterium]|nr:methyltransferase domain-containing protein [Solirubrobacterales bacterium]
MSSFEDVDGAADPERLARHLRALSEIGPIAAGRRERAELLGLRPGGRAIDVGCGLGDDARAIARIVGPSGHVVGVDASTALLDRARTRSVADDQRVEFVLGDAHRLQFDDGTFDAARTERTLQHLADPARAVGELARVTRAGGVVMASEPDWGTVALFGAPSELVRVLLSAAEERIRNAWVGRELAALFFDAGIIEMTVLAHAVVVREFELLRAVIDLPALSAEIRERNDSDIDELLARIEHDFLIGRAVAAITLFTVAGRVA